MHGGHLDRHRVRHHQFFHRFVYSARHGDYGHDYGHFHLRHRGNGQCDGDGGGRRRSDPDLRESEGGSSGRGVPGYLPDRHEFHLHHQCICQRRADIPLCGRRSFLHGIAGACSGSVFVHAARTTVKHRDPYVHGCPAGRHAATMLSRSNNVPGGVVASAGGNCRHCSR